MLSSKLPSYNIKVVVLTDFSIYSSSIPDGALGWSRQSYSVAQSLTADSHSQTARSCKPMFSKHYKTRIFCSLIQANHLKIKLLYQIIIVVVGITIIVMLLLLLLLCNIIVLIILIIGFSISIIWLPQATSRFVIEASRFSELFFRYL
jgi:type IV secretory pathway VirB6-like protein